MLRLDQNAKIRFNIMLIALLGGLGFLCYLLVNVHLANANKERLDELLNHRYPVIEQVRLLKQDVDNLRENLTAAVGLEDGFLVEDSTELADQFRAHARRLADMEPRHKALVTALLQSFEGYFDKARALALILIESDNNLAIYRQRVEETHRAFADVMSTVDALYETSQAEYTALLVQTHTAVNDANRVGALLGALVIAGLVLLAWGISVRVLQEINRSNRLKDAFLATISHELRTPMNGIIGALSLLRSGRLKREQEPLVQAASASADAMMVSIDDILEFSEIMSGQRCVNRGAVNLKGELESLFARFRQDFALRQLEFGCRVDGALAHPVMTDGQKVLHVARHLVSNGLKFTVRGRVDVAVDLLPAGDSCGSARVQIRVEDSGPGIDPADMSKLFRPFGQLDGSFRRQHQGMGIGLAICRAIARLLDGRVELQNRASGGIEAVFEFPVEMALPRAVPASVVKLAGDDQRPARLMVVEDNLVNQLVMKGYLKNLGFEVLTAANGQEALALLQQQTVNLILMDCQMPVMDGLEATRCIRRLPEPVGKVPIVAVTANVMDVDRAQCLAAGMNAFLKKPVDMDTLRATIGCYVSLPAG